VSWGEVTLGSIGEFKAGYGFPNSLQGKEVGDYPFAKVGDTSSVARSGEKYISSARNFLDKDELSLIKAKTVPVGSILFAKIGEAISQNFRVVTAVEMLIDNNTMGLLPDVSKINVDYLYYFMCGLDLYRYAGATTVPALRKSVLEEIKIPLPYPDDQEKSLKEQKRIAAILDKADGIRRKRQQATQLADDFLRSVFLDMFGDPVTNPKGWPERILKDVSDIRSGVTKGKKIDPKTSVTLPYMRVANVQDGYLKLDDIQLITVSPNDAKKCKLANGDILLTEGGDPDKLGRGHIWNGEVEDCIHQNHIFSVRIKDTEYVRPEFLSALIASQRGKRYFLRVGKQTTGIATINKTVLSEFLTFIPDIDEQDKYLSLLREIKAITQKNNGGHLNLFDSLSQRAFTGKI